MKAEALKEQTTTSRPIKALTVYLPNTPATLVPRVLPTKSSLKGKDVFEELEAEVDQNIVDRKHDVIKRKNLLIAHDNLIADCLSKEVFYVATNSDLNVSRFTEMHDAHTIVEARCLEPEAKLSMSNREVHLDYLRHLKESVETLHEIVEEAKVERPLDRSMVFACRYTKHSQKLLEYVIGTCPKDFSKQDKKHAPTPLIWKKQVTFEK
ncbi:hypothetical protein Tco_0486806 [Tanacetum coccineum]